MTLWYLPGARLRPAFREESNVSHGAANMGAVGSDCSACNTNCRGCGCKEDQSKDSSPKSERKDPVDWVATEPIELRPCPFCGSDAMFLFCFGMRVHCTKCTASALGVDYSQAADIWNKRASDSTYVDLPVHHKMRAGVDLWLSASGHYEVANSRIAGCEAGTFTSRAICKLADYPYNEKPRATV